MFKIKNITIVLLLWLLTLFIGSCKDNRTDYQKANDYFNAEKYDKAILHFNKSLKDGVKTSFLYKKLANSYIKLNRFQEALLYLRKAIMLTPDDEDLSYLYADILFKKKQYHNVISQLKRVTDSQRKFLILSDVYLISGNTKYSYNYLNKANEYNETKEEKIKMKYGFAKKVLSYHEKCVEKNKLFSDLYKDLKNDINFLKDYYKALTCEYDDLIQDRVSIRVYRLDEKFRYDTRFEILKKITQKEENKYFYNELAQIYIDKREFFKASNIMKESKSFDPNQDALIFLEAQIDIKKRRFSVAVEKLRKYYQKNKDLKSLKLLALAEYSLKNNYSAIKHYKEIVKKDNYNINPLYKLKELYERVGDKDSKTDMEYKIKFFNRKFYR